MHIEMPIPTPDPTGRAGIINAIAPNFMHGNPVRIEGLEMLEHM
jgi:hypothetical protein